MIEQESWICTIYCGYIWIGSGIESGIKDKIVIDGWNGCSGSGIYSRCIWQIGSSIGNRSYDWSGIWHRGFRGSVIGDGGLRTVIWTDTVLMKMSGVAMVIVIGAKAAFVFIVVMSSRGIGSP